MTTPHDLPPLPDYDGGPIENYEALALYATNYALAAIAPYKASLAAECEVNFQHQAEIARHMTENAKLRALHEGAVQDWRNACELMNKAEAEVERLRELLRETQPHLETAAEAAEERGIDNGKARQCLARIDAALVEKP